MYTRTDRHRGTPGLGSRLYSLDTTDPSAGWVRLPDTPGTPRRGHAFSSIGTDLYVIGGAVTQGTPPLTGLSSRARTRTCPGPQCITSTTVDSYKYSTLSKTWTRLADLPISSGNFQTNGQGGFMDRYILLIGGAQYPTVSARPALSCQRLRL